MNFSVSLDSEKESITNLIKLETSDGDGKPFLTLDLVDNNLTLKYSNFSIKSQVNSSFYGDISQFYIKDKDKVVTNNITIVKQLLV